MEDTVNKNLRNILLREMVSNVLMHREYSSTYQAKFIIERERMYVENANRAVNEGSITVNNLEPNSKNPIIAGFFRNIGYADQLGSGVRNLFKYTRFYSGQDPEFAEGDIFKIIVPLDDNYSLDHRNGANGDSDFGTIDTISADRVRELSIPYAADRRNISFSEKSAGILSQEEVEILDRVKKNPYLTQSQIQKEMGISLRSVKRIMSRLQQEGILIRKGNNRSGSWMINDEVLFDR